MFCIQDRVSSAPQASPSRTALGASRREFSFPGMGSSCVTSQGLWAMELRAGRPLPEKPRGPPTPTEQCGPEPPSASPRVPGGPSLGGSRESMCPVHPAVGTQQRGWVQEGPSAQKVQMHTELPGAKGARGPGENIRVPRGAGKTPVPALEAWGLGKGSL